MSGKKRSVAILGCAGIISGILPMHLLLPRDFLHNMEGYGGSIYGIILAICLWAFRYYPRSIARAIAVVVSSTVAYNAAMFSTIWVDMFIPHPAFNFGTGTGNTNPPSYVMFVGGVLGALIISTTVLLLYRDESTDLGTGILLCTLGGGVLGVFGYSLGLLFTGQDHNPGYIPGMFALHVIWQTGMGCLLAAFLPDPVWRAQTQPFREDSSLPSSDPIPREKHARKIPLWGKLFIGLVTVALISYIARVTWVGHDVRCLQNEFTRYQQTRPSLEKLEPVVPMPDEQAVILHPIAGRTAQLWGRFNNAAIGNQAASVSFTACYMHLPNYRCEANHPPDVRVKVSQWPNSLWSAYELQGMQYRLSARCSTLPKRIQKFGNAVMAEENPKDAGIGKFYWTSGAVLIVFDSDVSDSDEFIREYLERYPSTL